jgi:hypothetical protein
MKSFSLARTLLLLNLVLCALLTVWLKNQYNEAAAARAELAGITRRSQEELSHLRADLAAAIRERDAAAAEHARAAALATTTAPKPPASPVAQFEERRGVFADQLRTLPEYTAHLVRNARREMLEEAGDGLDALQLPPDKLETLKQLLTERHLALADAIQVATAQGLAQNSRATVEARRKIQEEHDAKLRVLLGESGFTALQEQMAVQQHRRIVLDGCNVALAERGVPPLDSGQMLDCFRAHFAAQKVMRSPGSREEWAAAVLRELPPTLSPAQRDEFVEQTYAWMRRTALRTEITKQVAAKGG